MSTVAVFSCELERVYVNYLKYLYISDQLKTNKQPKKGCRRSLSIDVKIRLPKDFCCSTNNPQVKFRFLSFSLFFVGYSNFSRKNSGILLEAKPLDNDDGLRLFLVLIYENLEAE